MTASPEQADEFATAFRAFLEWIHQPVTSPRNEVVDLVRGHLGRERSDTSVVTRQLPVFDHVNLQVALDAWTAQPGREVRIEGLIVPQHHETPELQQLLQGVEQLICDPARRPWSTWPTERTRHWPACRRPCFWSPMRAART